MHLKILSWFVLGESTPDIRSFSATLTASWCRQLIGNVESGVNWILAGVRSRKVYVILQAAPFSQFMHICLNRWITA